MRLPTTSHVTRLAGIAAVGFAILFTGAVPNASAERYDVVVYGGTSAGVMSAVQASKMGKTVIIVEPDSHLGGLTAGGLGWTDSGNKNTIGGLARVFYQRIKQHYDNPESWVLASDASGGGNSGELRRKDYSRYRPDDDAMWTFEPKVAEQLFESLVKEHNIPVIFNDRLNRKSGVVKNAGRIVSITTISGRTFTGRMFIDATYEGDLLAAAGVSFNVGREGNAVYDESLNGVQKQRNTHKHLFVKNVDPYVIPGKPESGVLPGVSAEPAGEEGQRDHRVQAYCYRMCMSNIPGNSVPFPKPADYNEQRYELLLRNFEAGDLRLPLKPDMMPNGKTDTNNNCAFSTDNLGMNYKYPEGSYAEREKILAEHQSYQKGLMWTLANHPRVPESIRSEMAKWGLAKDEFVDSENWPHQIYVREARRMVGEYVNTEHDCRRVRVAADSVGLGSYNMDSHNTQRYITADGFVQNEGDIQQSPGGSYVISYRAIVPKRGEVENLLVPICVSASHIAYGSIRMEPVFMALGQSAATAAVMAIDDGIAVQDVDYPKLRKRLLADGQALDIRKGTKPKPVVSVEKLEGVVVDDKNATYKGDWTASSSTDPYIGAGYHHDGNVEKGQKLAIFNAQLKPGRYEVRLAYTQNKNRATRVPVRIVCAGGRTEFKRIDQTQAPKLNNAFVSLGTFAFDAAAPATVEVGTEGTTGYVVVDAVQFIPAK